MLPEAELSSNLPSPVLANPPEVGAKTPPKVALDVRVLAEPITCTKNVRAFVPLSRALIEPTPRPVPLTPIVLLDLARMPPLSRRRSRKLLMTRPPVPSNVSELMTFVERTVAAAPELMPALTTRVLVLAVTAALAAGALVSASASGLTPWVASRVRNWVVLVVPTLPTSTSATAQGMMRIVFPLVVDDPMNVLQPLGAVVVPRNRFVFVAPEACPKASPRMNSVALFPERRVAEPTVVMRRFAPVLSNEMTLWPVVTAMKPSLLTKASLTGVVALPMSSRCPPKRSTRRVPRRTLLAVVVLSRVSRVPGSRVSAAALPFRVIVPASPSVPAPLTMTRPRLMVVASKVLAAVSVRVFVPTLVRVWFPLTTPLRVMSPEVTPERALTRLPPMLVPALSEIVPDQVAAVPEELMRAPSEVTVPLPVIVPEPPKPAPAIVRGSMPIVRPFKSSTAPVATLVTCQGLAEAAPRAPTWPSLTMPALMVIGPCNVVSLFVLRNRVLVPVFVSVEEAAEVMTPKVRSP